MAGVGRPQMFFDVAATPVAVRNSPGTIVGGFVYNKQFTDGYILLFDKLATNVVMGTTMPDYAIAVFGQSATDLCRAGEGLLFMNGITIAVVDSAPLGTVGLASNVGVALM